MSLQGYSFQVIESNLAKFFVVINKILSKKRNKITRPFQLKKKLYFLLAAR